MTEIGKMRLFYDEERGKAWGSPDATRLIKALDYLKESLDRLEAAEAALLRNGLTP